MHDVIELMCVLNYVVHGLDIWYDGFIELVLVCTGCYWADAWSDLIVMIVKLR